MKRLSVNEDFNFDNEDFDNIIEPSLKKLKFYRKIVDHFPDLIMFSNCIGKKIQLVNIYRDLVEGTEYDIYGNRIDAPNRMTKLHIGPKENPEGKCTYLAHVGFIQSINLIFDVFSKIEKYMFNSEDMTKRAYKEFEDYRKEHKALRTINLELKESFNFDENIDLDQEIHYINLDRRLENLAKDLINLAENEYGMKNLYSQIVFDLSIGLIDLCKACETNLFPEKEGFNLIFSYEEVQGAMQMVIRIMNEDGMSEILASSGGPKITQVVNFFCRWFDYPFERAKKIIEKDGKIFLNT